MGTPAAPPARFAATFRWPITATTEASLGQVHVNQTRLAGDRGPTGPGAGVGAVENGGEEAVPKTRSAGCAACGPHRQAAGSGSDRERLGLDLAPDHVHAANWKHPHRDCLRS